MAAANLLSTCQLVGASYPIWVGSEILGSAALAMNFSKYTKVAAVVDEVVFEKWGSTLQAALPSHVTFIRLQTCERDKSIESVGRIWQSLLDLDVDRKSLVLAIGGGVLCDVAGFAVATYMRGCALAVLPTTLLAQVDAGVGGKTGFNFGGIKNLIGTISQPAAVFIDTSFLRTLPRYELANGAAEMIKHGLVADLAHFNALAELDADVAVEGLSELLRRSLAIKLKIVGDDPNEQGARKLLNFGHSLGHAIEASALDSAVEISHGRAVAIGMIGEAYISLEHGWITQQDLERIETVLSRWKLPVRIPPGITRDSILSKLAHDKKNVAGDLKMALLKKLGQAAHDCPVSQDAVRGSLDYVFRANHSK